MSERSHKAVNLYGEQINQFKKAKAALESRVGESMTEGEVIRVVCACYTTEEVKTTALLPDLYHDHASNYNDATFSIYELEELHDIDNNLLRRLAKRSTPDDMNGRGFTMYELKSFFARCGKQAESDGQGENSTKEA